MVSIVYRTENKVNGKFYYGVHSGTNNSYLGSGKALKHAISKYGRSNFIRRTIMEFDAKDQAYSFEKLLVDQQFIDDPSCYNMTAGGHGGWDGKRMHETGLKQSAESREATRAKITGLKRSIECKKRMSKLATGHSRSVRGKNARAIPIIINGIKYSCKRDAYEALGLKSIYHLNKYLAKLRE